MTCFVRTVWKVSVLLAVMACTTPLPDESPSIPSDSAALQSTPRLLGWCCSTTDSAIIATQGRYESTPPADRPPELAMIHYRHTSGFDARTQMVIRDSASWGPAWLRLLGSHSPKPPLPRVDFSREMLVIASMGTRSSGGYSIAIDSVYVERDTVFFKIRERSPGPSCGTTAALTAPVGLARVERSDLPVGFAISTLISECP